MAKYGFEFKKKIVFEHLNTGIGSKLLAQKYDVKSQKQIRQWIHNYNKFGDEGLKRSRQNQIYSFEFKLHMVESYCQQEKNSAHYAKIGITSYFIYTKKQKV